MRVLRNQEEALEVIRHQEEPLSAILEIRDQGLELFFESSPEKLLTKIEEETERLGKGFHFRVFNGKIDVSWKGDYGVFLEGEVKKEDTDLLYLETDTRRHPGMLAFQGGLGSLEKVKLRVQFLSQEGEGGYMRLVEIVGGGGD